MREGLSNVIQGFPVESITRSTSHRGLAISRLRNRRLELDVRGKVDPNVFEKSFLLLRMDFW